MITNKNDCDGKKSGFARPTTARVCLLMKQYKMLQLIKDLCFREYNFAMLLKNWMDILAEELRLQKG